MNYNGFILLLLLMSGILFACNFFMRKLFKVKGKKWFSYNHINRVHMKIDWMIRIAFILTLIGIASYRISKGSAEMLWYFREVWLVFLLFIFISEAVRAFMEWKYEANRKAYMLTICKMALIMILSISVVTVNFF